MQTFGQALVELAAMGDADWVESYRTAFSKYVTVTRLGPEPHSKPRPDHRPNTPAYLEKRGDHSVGIGHLFKYPYSYYDLLRRARDPLLARAWEKKAYPLF